MSTQTLTRSLATSLPGKYVSLVTYKRDGTPVATPMWFMPDGDRLLMITDARSGKVKRIRRDPDVTLATCKSSGRITGPPIAAQAEILPPEALEHAEQLYLRRYRWERVILPIYRLVQRIRGNKYSGESVVIALTPR